MSFVFFFLCFIFLVYICEILFILDNVEGKIDLCYFVVSEFDFLVIKNLVIYEILVKYWV